MPAYLQRVMGCTADVPVISAVLSSMKMACTTMFSDQSRSTTHWSCDVIGHGVYSSEKTNTQKETKKARNKKGRREGRKEGRE